jgi:hypothetical protein
MNIIGKYYLNSMRAETHKRGLKLDFFVSR